MRTSNLFEEYMVVGKRSIGVGDHRSGGEDMVFCRISLLSGCEGVVEKSTLRVLRVALE